MRPGKLTIPIEKQQESASQVQSTPSSRYAVCGRWAFRVVSRDAVDEECVDVADSLGSDIIRRLVG